MSDRPPAGRERAVVDTTGSGGLLHREGTMNVVPARARVRAKAASTAPAAEDTGPQADADRHPAGSGPVPEIAAPPPEEMKATADIRLGQSVSIRATVRATPAGLIAAALLVSATLIPLVLLSRT